MCVICCSLCWIFLFLGDKCVMDLFALPQSYTAVPTRGYVPDIRNVPPAARMTVDIIPDLSIYQSKTFEKCTKVSVDGKSTKIGKNDILKLENNKLFIAEEKGCNKVLVSEFSRYQEQPSKSSKDLLYAFNKSVVKIHCEPSEIVEMKTILQRLLGKRTQYSLLESKGIAKNEPYFGNTLENICLREKRDIPEFVTKITRLLEAPKNIKSTGIYRTSGNIATIQKIRCKVDLNKLTILDEYKDDADVLTGTLKMFFRELKESAIGVEEFNALSEITISGGRISGHKRKGLIKKFTDKMPPHAETFLATVEVIQRLSKPKRETVEHLMRHMLRVISYEDENSMGLQSMAICWGPSLINLDIGNSRDEVYAAMQKKNTIVELLLRSYKFIENQQRPSGSRLSLASERPSLQRMDSTEGLKNKWSSMTALDREDNINEEFVLSLMSRIEAHKDVERAYQKSEGDKMASKIMSKVKQKRPSKTLARLLEKAKIEELCTLLKYCYDDQLISTIRPTDFTNLEKLRDNIKRTCTDEDEVSTEMFNAIRSLAKKQIIFEQFVLLFAHLHRIISANRNPVSKHYEVSVFWFKTICGLDHSKQYLPIVWYIIDAFKETDWINSTGEEEEQERKISTAEIVLRSSKNSSSGLTLISEENTNQEHFSNRDDCVDCCTTKRPVTFAYTKAD